MPSFGEELGRLIPHMRRFAKALVRGHSGQVADNLVQETVVLAMRAERMVRGPHLRAWCFCNLMRVHRHWEQAGAGRAEARAQDVPDDGATLAFMPREIARLDVLPLDNREVLLLVVLAGMNYSQVAETLHVTTETVLSRLDAARAILARGQRHAPSTASGTGVPAHKGSRGARYLHVVK